MIHWHCVFGAVVAGVLTAVIGYRCGFRAGWRNRVSARYYGPD